MGKFFREYWAWIVVPFVLVLGAVALLLLTGGGSGDGSSPFVYPVF